MHCHELVQAVWINDFHFGEFIPSFLFKINATATFSRTSSGQSLRELKNAYRLIAICENHYWERGLLGPYWICNERLLKLYEFRTNLELNRFSLLWTKTSICKINRTLNVCPRKSAKEQRINKISISNFFIGSNFNKGEFS